MDINRIREFLVLSEQLNYSKAANLLYITQPVLSRHIHSLEEVFGGQLFIRDTHKVELTDFGKLCAQQLQDVVDSYDTALIRIRNAVDTSNDALTVGFMDYAVRPFLNQFASWFETAHPDIDIDYSSGNLDDLTESVLEDRADLAFLTFVNAESMTSKELESQHIYDDRIYAVFNPSHPCAGKESISLDELSIYPLISFGKTTNPVTWKFYLELFEKKGLHVDVVKEVSSFESGLFYAKAGLGAFMIPQHLSSLADDLGTVLISDEGSTLSLNLVWKKQNPKKSLQTYVHDFELFYRSR